jgi:hypothetical protein
VVPTVANIFNHGDHGEYSNWINLPIAGEPDGFTGDRRCVPRAPRGDESGC